MRDVGAVLVAAFGVMHFGLILFRSVEPPLPFSHHRTPVPIKQRVCVLIKRADNGTLLKHLAASIEGDYAYSYGVFLLGEFDHSIRRRFPSDTLFYSAQHNNESTVESLLYAAGVKGCSFLFFVDKHPSAFIHGWASSWVSALKALNPPFVGAVVPCEECVFIHRAVHHRVFQRPREEPLAWLVRSVFGVCRVVGGEVAAVDVHPSVERLRVAKFLLALGSPATCP